MSIPQVSMLNIAIPGPHGRPLLGHLKEFKNSPLSLFLSATQQYGDAVQFQILNRRVFLFNHPQAVKHILLDNHQNYSKKTIVVKKLMVLGNGLIFSEGEEWKRQRKMLQPSFRKKCLHNFFTIMSQEAQNAAEAWYLEARREINLSQEITKLTLRIVCRSLFGSNIDIGQGLGNSVAYLLHAARARTLNLFNLPMSFPTPANIRFKLHRRVLSDHIQALVKKRRIDGPGDDMLSMLLYHEDTISEEELLNQVQTFLLAGHDTTANAVLWCLYLLSKNGECLQDCRDELASIQIESAEKLQDLPLLRQVIQEALRLYPPAWIIPRFSIGADEILGKSIPGGHAVYLSPYTLHRHPDYWPQAERFDPRRFAVALQEPNSYIPFGAGPRICIGREFAMQEAMIILAAILKRFDIKVIGETYLPKAGITLRPHKEMIATIRPAKLGKHDRNDRKVVS